MQNYICLKVSIIRILCAKIDYWLFRFLKVIEDEVAGTFLTHSVHAFTYMHI